MEGKSYDSKNARRRLRVDLRELRFKPWILPVDRISEFVYEQFPESSSLVI